MNLKENPATKFLFEARDELTKVVWPTRRQTVNHALLVIGISVATAVYFGVVDLILSKGLEGLLSFRR